MNTVKRLFFHFHSDGTNRPYRCSIRAPGFAHLAGADFMMRREYPLRRRMTLIIIVDLFSDVRQPVIGKFVTNAIFSALHCGRRRRYRYHGSRVWASDFNLFLHSGLTVGYREVDR